MAGNFISVDVIGRDSLQRELNRLLEKGTHLEPALREIGEYLIESTQLRFTQMQSPEGVPWQALSKKTLAKKKRPDRILTESGTLADTLTYQTNHNQLMFGTNLEYGATHQFGRDEANIPARPYIGINREDQTEILEILRHHLVSA